MRATALVQVVLAQLVDVHCTRGRPKGRLVVLVEI